MSIKVLTRRSGVCLDPGLAPREIQGECSSALGGKSWVTARRAWNRSSCPACFAANPCRI